MQGDRDRHCEIAFAGREMIGFLIGKVDKPEHKGHKKVGYGYVMEFYVMPEFRLSGYGRKMFIHLERLFANDGATRMYLNTNTDGGKEFWSKLGFVQTDETGNADVIIWEKAVDQAPLNEIVYFVKTFEYGTPKVGEKLAVMNGRFENYESFISGKYGKMNEPSVKQMFTVYAENAEGEILGAVVFTCRDFTDGDWVDRNAGWEMTDLDVRWDMRRNGIGTKLVNAGIARLIDLSAENVISTRSINNTASVRFHNSLGFKSYERTDASDPESYVRLTIPHNYNLTPIQEWRQVMYIHDLQGRLRNLSSDERERFYKAQLAEMISELETQHFIVRRGLVEIGYVCVANGNIAELLISERFKDSRIEKFISSELTMTFC